MTEAGKSIYKDAKYIIQYSKESLIRAENTMQGDKEVIRVGISPMTPPQFFWQFISQNTGTLSRDKVSVDPV